MRFEDQLMIIMDLYPSPVIIDRLPGSGPDELPIPHPRMRRPGLPSYSPPVAAIFPIMVEPPPGGQVTDDALATIMEKRLADPMMPLTRFPKLQLLPKTDGDEEVESDL
jgi:hypothetical protein